MTRRTQAEIEQRRALASRMPPVDTTMRHKSAPRKTKPLMTDEQIDARLTAFEEAASHLEMAWADTAEEFAQGLIVAEFIRNAALNWHIEKLRYRGI